VAIQELAEEWVGPIVMRVIRHKNEAWLQVQHAAAPHVICVRRFGPYDYELALDSFCQIVNEQRARRDGSGW
jgi:hypothetical protein